MNRLRLPQATAAVSRRSLLGRIGAGLYGAALFQLLGEDLHGARPSARRIYDVRPRAPMHPPKARAVIQLFMNGGPSQMDLFDPKDELDRNHGKDYFKQIADEVEFPKAAGALMKRSQ